LVSQFAGAAAASTATTTSTPAAALVPQILITPNLIIFRAKEDLLLPQGDSQSDYCHCCHCGAMDCFEAMKQQHNWS